METLFNQSRRLLRMTSLNYVRPIIQQVHWNQRLVSIRGARGVGKTTLLLQYIKQTYGDNPKEAIYVSLDNLYFSRHSFLDFVDDFYKMGGKHIFADEVHKYHGWSQELKNAYDAYPDMRFVITGSSILTFSTRMPTSPAAASTTICKDCHSVSIRACAKAFPLMPWICRPY